LASRSPRSQLTNEKRLDMKKIPRPGKSAKGALNKPVIALAEYDKPEPVPLTPMDFRVPEPFHREFKMHAVQHGISMVELLQVSFRVLKVTRGR
jgi:hypothetical protein